MTILIILFLMLFIVPPAFAPLLVTEDMQDIVNLEQQPCSCDCSQ